MSEVATARTLRAEPDQVRFACIVADPPWRFGDKLPGNGRGAAKHYPTMSVDDIASWFELPPIADDAYLFLWRVAAMQEEALIVADAWGFTVKSEIVWVKRTAHGKRWFGMGRTVRAEHEICLIATRGRPRPLSRSVRSVFEAQVPYTNGAGVNDRGFRLPKHSAKPEEFFDIVESLVPGPYVELFARRQRAGWRCLGNELPDPGESP